MRPDNIPRLPVEAAEYNPTGSTIVWEVVTGDRVDRIHVLDTHHIQTRLALRMVQEEQLRGAAFASGHSHDPWQHLSSEQALEIRQGKRYVIIGHTIWLDDANQVEDGMIWVPAHVFRDGFRFRSEPTMVAARAVVAQHDLVSRTVDRAYEKSFERRFSWSDRIREQRGQVSP